MQASHELSRVSVSFDEPNLVSHAGLVPVAELAQRLQVGERIDAAVTLAGSVGANSGAKALTLIGSVLAGGDCIDDVDLLRSGALPELFDGVRARPRWGPGCGRCAGGMSASSTRSPGRCWSGRGGPAPARPPGLTSRWTWTRPSARCTGWPNRARPAAIPGCVAITRCWPAAPVTRPAAAPPSCCTPGCAAATPGRAAAPARSWPRC